MDGIRLFRISLALFAALEAAAHLFPSPSGSAIGQFWFNIEVVVYALLAITFILGLRRWYVLAVAFSILNIFMFIAAGLTAIPGVTAAPLTGNIDFMHYDISRLFSVLGYIYIIVAGALLWLKDRSSKIEKLY